MVGDIIDLEETCLSLITTFRADDEGFPVVDEYLDDIFTVRALHEQIYLLFHLVRYRMYE